MRRVPISDPTAPRPSTTAPRPSTTAPRPSASAPPTAGLLGIHRSADERIVAGVAAGIAHRLGLDPVLVRTAFVVLAFAGGVGVLVYGVAWAITPFAPTSTGADGRTSSLQQSVAFGLIVLGVLLLLRHLGLWFGDVVVFPLLLAAAGSAIVWTRSDDTDRDRWSRAATRHADSAVSAVITRPVSPARLVIGTVFVGTGIAGFLAANEGLAALRDLGLAVVATLIGTALLLGPWLSRLSGQLGAERRERIRQVERAELAAHLHDSVLQTLALIQRSGDQPRRMVALARRQERELRAWLYGRHDDLVTPSNLEAAVEEIADEVEASHDLGVDVVVVGDAPIDDDVRALLGAVREACVNAAKHADVDTVAVYVEAEPDLITAFVRDRGAGFDPDAVPADRHGIRASIVGRLAGHGGRARVSSSPGSGTEVELTLPRAQAAAAATTPDTPEEAP